MPLTTQQLMIINNLMYSENPSLCDSGSGNPQINSSGKTLGEIVTQMDPVANNKDFEFGSVEEWKIIKKTVLNDPTLSKVTVEKSYYDPATGDAGCVLKNGKEAIIAFRGTGRDEWRDDARAGGKMKVHGADETISPQQQKAIDYVNNLDLSEYDTVTVTGHSKGGNKAKIVTLLTDKVDRCVSFDGQGFSDEFMQLHKDDIIANQGKIENHNVDKDYVNILLNDVGKTQYYESQRTENNVLKNHSPTAFLTDDGGMKPGQQSPVTKKLDNLLNRMLRDIPPEKKPYVLEFIGELMDDVVGTGSNDRAGSLIHTLTHPKYREALKILAAYGLLEVLTDVPIIGPVIKKLRDWGLLPKVVSGDDLSHGEDIRYDSGGRRGGGASGADRILVSTEAMQRTVLRYKDARQRLTEAEKRMDAAWEQLNHVWDGPIKITFRMQWITLMGNIRKSETSIDRSIDGLSRSINLFTDNEADLSSIAQSLSPGTVPPLF